MLLPGQEEIYGKGHVAARSMQHRNDDDDHKKAIGITVPAQPDGRICCAPK